MDGKTRLGLILGLSAIIAAFILGMFFYEAQKPKSTIQVVGLGLKEFEADTVKWVITVEEETGPEEPIKTGYRRLENSIEALKNKLSSLGIEEGEINLKTPTIYKDYNYNLGTVTRIRHNQVLFVITQKIDTVEKLAMNPVELLDQDINVINSQVEFFYSGTDELKKTLVSEATANAKERAQMMLKDTDVKLGRLISVRSGIFQITEPYSTDVSSMGIYDTSTRKKQISVTATAVFALK